MDHGRPQLVAHHEFMSIQLDSHTTTLHVSRSRDQSHISASRSSHVADRLADACVQLLHDRCGAFLATHEVDDPEWWPGWCEIKTHFAMLPMLVSENWYVAVHDPTADERVVTMRDGLVIITRCSCCCGLNQGSDLRLLSHVTAETNSEGNELRGQRSNARTPTGHVLNPNCNLNPCTCIR